MLKKRLLIALVAMVFVLSSVNVFAATKTTINPNLTFNGTTAHCSVSVFDYGKNIDITLELWQGNTLIHSWPANRTSYVIIDEYSLVTSGCTYTLLVTGTIDDVYINCTPVTKTCP